MWEYLSVFQDQWVFLCSVSVALGQTHSFQKYRLQTGGLGSFYCSTSGVWIGQFLCHFLGAPTSHEEPTDIMKLTQLCLFSLRAKVLSHSVLECVMSSLASLIPRLTRQKGLNFFPSCLVLRWSLYSPYSYSSPIIGYWCKVYSSTYGKVQPSWPFVFLMWMPKHILGCSGLLQHILCAHFDKTQYILSFSLAKSNGKKNEAPLRLSEHIIVFYFFEW